MPHRLADAVGQTGQADYSEQWTEYYRSMGMDKDAEAIETARVSQILFRALYSNSGIHYHLANYSNKVTLLDQLN